MSTHHPALVNRSRSARQNRMLLLQKQVGGLVRATFSKTMVICARVRPSRGAATTVEAKAAPAAARVQAESRTPALTRRRRERDPDFQIHAGYIVHMRALHRAGRTMYVLCNWTLGPCAAQSACYTSLSLTGSAWRSPEGSCACRRAAGRRRTWGRLGEMRAGFPPDSGPPFTTHQQPKASLHVSLIRGTCAEGRVS